MSSRRTGNHRSTSSRVRLVEGLLRQLGFGWSSNVDHYAVTTSSKRRRSTRARPKNARSRDTGTTATPLASCAPARRLQTVYIDARRTHRTVSDVPCRYNPRRRRQSNTNRVAFGGYCIVPETQMLQRTRRTGFLIRWPTRLERSSTCTSWYSRPETVQKSTKNILF